MSFCLFSLVPDVIRKCVVLLALAVSGHLAYDALRCVFFFTGARTRSRRSWTRLRSYSHRLKVLGRVLISRAVDFFGLDLLITNAKWLSGDGTKKQDRLQATWCYSSRNANIARTMEIGCKMLHYLALRGAQTTGKSSWIRMINPLALEVDT